MFSFFMFVFAHILLQGSACPDPVTTVHIQHHDGPIYVSPDRATIGNHGTCCNRSPCQPHGNQQQLLHTYPCNVCETDCKCVTKKLSTCVPINTVPQNTCTPTYYSCPDYSYGYGCHPECHGTDGCLITSEGLIPLLKTYIGQNKCCKHGCQCVQNYPSY